MTVEVEAAKPPQGVSIIFLGLLGAFALSGAALVTGALGAFGVFAFVLIGWIVSLCLHEWGHAVTAWAGGDRSVEERGYLTLNPLHYANPVLSIVMPLLFLAMGGIGFPGGAVYVKTDALRGPFWRSAVSAAGPAMNLICLLLIAVALSLFDQYDEPSPLALALALLGFLQATALLLNLLPIPGFDGFGILSGVLPAGVRRALIPISSIAVMVFLAVILFAPGLLNPLWAACIDLCALLGIDITQIADGLNLFRFWDAPAPGVLNQ